MKGKRILTLLGSVCLILVLAAIPLLGACAPAPEPPTPPAPAPPVPPAPPPKVVELLIGGSYSLTGPYAAVEASYFRGGMDYIAYANDEELLGPNVKIKAIWGDDKMSVPDGLSILEDQIAKGVLVYDFTASGVQMACKERLLELDLPSVTHAESIPAITQPSTIFLAVAVTTDSGAGAGEWFMEQWKEDRKPRMAYLTMDMPPGRLIVQPELIAHLESIGFEVVGEQYIPVPTVSPPTTQLAWLKKNKVDFTYGFLIPSGGVPMLKEAIRQDMGPELGYKIVFAESEVVPEPYIRALGTHTNGFVVGGGTPGLVGWPEPPTEIPGVALALELIKRYRQAGTEYADIASALMYYRGVASRMVTVEAIKNALKKKPADQLTRKDILEGFHEIKDFDLMGIYPPVTFGPDDSYGPEELSVLQLNHGKVELVGRYPIRNLYPH